MKMLFNQEQERHGPYKKMLFKDVLGSIIALTDKAPSTKEDFVNIGAKIRFAGDTEGNYVGFQCGTMLIKCINTKEAREALAVRMETKASRAYNELKKSPIPAPVYCDNHLPFCKDAPKFKVVKLTDAKKEGIMIESCEDTDAPVKKIARTAAKIEPKAPVSMPATPILDSLIDFAAFDAQYKVPSLQGYAMR